MDTHPPLPGVSLTFSEVFPGGGGSDEVFFSIDEWEHPVCFFVGRNGSGKSRTAKLIADNLNGRRLSTDRLSGLVKYDDWGHTSAPNAEGFPGIPLGDKERERAQQVSKLHGTGIAEIYAIKQEPEVWLQVAAFVRRAFGRTVVLKEKSGYLDPFIRLGTVEYSLLRDEGHGLRELLILLIAVYRSEWRLLVVDEPELHLHPAMARIWLSELQKVCADTNRRAIVVTHQPTLIRPKVSSDLNAIFYFSAGKAAASFSAAFKPDLADQVTASLTGNSELVSQLVFAPRPVLVEGKHDVAALTVALERTQPGEVVAQTDLIDCGGSGTVALWFEIADALNIDVRAIADLDACLEKAVNRVMDRSIDVQQRYQNDLSVEPPKTSTVLAPLIQAMNADGIEKNAKERAKWLANSVLLPGHQSRITKLIDIWKDHGFWLHAQGTLEDVLGIPEDKGLTQAQLAAKQPGLIDEVAKWCAYKLDASGEIKALLAVNVERIAHAIMEAQRDQPELEFAYPVDGPESSDARLVNVEPTGDGAHRLTVLKPDEFAGWSLVFSRDSPANDLNLAAPDGTAS